MIVVSFLVLLFRGTLDDSIQTFPLFVAALAVDISDKCLVAVDIIGTLTLFFKRIFSIFMIIMFLVITIVCLK